MILEERYIEFITKHNLTQSQFLLLHLMYKKKFELIKRYRECYPTDNGSMLGKNLTNDLITRGFLIKVDSSYKLGDIFLDIYIDEFTAGNEIWELYPKFIIINGTNIPLTTMDKNLFRKIYIDKILYNREEHLEVVKDIEYGNKNELINLGIDKFINSEFWKVLREKRINDANYNESINLYEENDF